MPAQHSWIMVWVIVSSIIVVWDATYCFMRPRSFFGGDLHWIWKPYALYQNIDLIYGTEVHRRGDGFTNAQSLLNIFEVLGNLTYFYKAQIAENPMAPVLGLCVAIATLSKTVLYMAQEYFCSYCAVGHNDRWTLIFLWIVPNGVWIVVPTLVISTLYSDIAKSLRGPGVAGRSVPAGRKFNGKSQ